jgi:O-glycosyl hydrolase
MLLKRDKACFCALGFLLACCLAAAPTIGADAVDYDPNGIIRAAVEWPRETPMRASVGVVAPGWKSIVQQETLGEVKRVAGADGAFSRDGIAQLDGRRVAISQSAEPTCVTYRCIAPDADVSLAGVYWFANFPIKTFTGGRIRIGERDIALAPAKNIETRALGDAAADRVTIRSADGRTTIELAFDRVVSVRVQDVTAYGDPSFQIYVPIVEGDLSRGAAHRLAISITTTLLADGIEAVVTIDPAGKRSAFDGFGGNFVYGAASPVTRATLDALRLTWARVPLELREWEPTNDNGDASLTNQGMLAAHDVSGSRLRKRFELDQELFQRSEGRMIATLWYPPEWLFAEPLDTEWREQPGIVPREHWPELAECVVSYLLHLKSVYGVEPRLFSFNESDQGVYVKLDGESMRDLTKLLRDQFAKAGLKTMLLLGDSADLAKGLAQIEPTLADDEARSFVGGLAYHPWAGQNEQWGAWADLAEKLGLPLLTTEMGADADSWRDGSFASPRYALRLARRYVEQLSTARSRALIEWEWSDDFPMTKAGADGKQMLSPRGEWLRLLTHRTPQFGETIATRCDRTTLRAAAVAKGEAWSVQMINLDAARTVRVCGLPKGISTMTLGIVDPIEGARADRQVAVDHGQASVTLPAGAMAILSTAAK